MWGFNIKIFGGVPIRVIKPYLVPPPWHKKILISDGFKRVLLGAMTIPQPRKGTFPSGRV